MTIKAQVEYMMNHPYMPVAMRDRDAMEKLLFETIFHTYSVCSANAAKMFRMNKWLNTPEIYTAIRDIEPPSNLDVRMPIPLPEDECLVVPMKKLPEIVYIEPKKIRVKLSPNPFQILITFPEPRMELMEG